MIWNHVPEITYGVNFVRLIHVMVDRYISIECFTIHGIWPNSQSLTAPSNPWPTLTCILWSKIKSTSDVGITGSIWYHVANNYKVRITVSSSRSTFGKLKLWVKKKHGTGGLQCFWRVHQFFFFLKGSTSTVFFSFWCIESHGANDVDKILYKGTTL